jgi:alkylation response protein AidB-like acyl-CoA dehydrogenase
VTYPVPFGAQTAGEREAVERARAGAEVAAQHAARHDRDGTFPEEGLAALAESGYLGLVIPRELGGRGAGVAEAARDFALGFARERRPTALGGRSIASLPQIRQRAGRLELLLYQARGLLVSTARAFDAHPDANMDGALAAAKVTATNLAVQVAEEAMRLVGGSSLERGMPLERHFRDVRGGLHHPPQDDAALELLAHQALD